MKFIQHSAFYYNTEQPFKNKTLLLSDCGFPMGKILYVVEGFNILLSSRECSIFILENHEEQSSHCGSAEMNPTCIHLDAGAIPGLARQAGDPVFPRAVV